MKNIKVKSVKSLVGNGNVRTIMGNTHHIRKLGGC